MSIYEERLNDLSVPTGIEHGPYPPMPQSMVDLYVSQLGRRWVFPAEASLEDFIADRESEWLGDQQSEAVERAWEREELPISGEKANKLLGEIRDGIEQPGLLRPWWIGTRVVNGVYHPPKNPR